MLLNLASAQPHQGALVAWQQRLQHLYSALLDDFPFVGRTCRETVIVLTR